jgi:iron complex outermembrane receptor protein
MIDFAGSFCVRTAGGGYRRIMTTASALALASLGAGTALAQAAGTPPGDTGQVATDPGQTLTGGAPAAGAARTTDSSGEIVVTGLRRSLQDSINAKRKSTNIVEVISAEDIGKLPDTSIAESLARLPGVAGQRVDGRVHTISIRGLPDQFTTTLLNGREQVTSGDNRAVEFDQYPSELINSVVVYKTSNAGLMAQGIAGTVDMRAIRPLSLTDRTIAINARGELNGFKKLNADGSRAGFRVSASYVDQFLDHTLGVAIGYAHLDTPTQIKHQKSWFWDPMPSGTPPVGPLGPENNDVLNLGGQEVNATNRSQIRDGLMGVVQYQPNDAFQVTVDTYYSKFKQTETTRSLQWYSDSQTPDGTQFLDPTIIDYGAERINVAGTATNITPVGVESYNRRRDEMFAAGFNTSYKTGGTTFTLDLGYSHMHRKEQSLETYAGYGLSRTAAGTQRTFDNIDYDISTNGFSTYTPGLDYADAGHMELGDPAAWGGWGHDGAIRFPDVTDRLYTIDFRINQDLKDTALGGFLSSVEVGANYNNRRKDKTVDEYDLMLKNGRTPVAIDPKYLNDPTSLGFAGIPGMISYDIEDVYRNYYDQLPIKNSDNYNKNWMIEEKILKAYTMANIDAEVAGIKITGNFGLQYVHTDQASTGYSVPGNIDASSPATPVLGTIKDRYDFVLPSGNIVLDFGKGYYVRAGIAKTAARPRLDDLRSSVSAGVDQISGLWSGSGGNPTLKPWKADAYDVTFEKYFGRTGYFSANAFYKKLETYIYNLAVPFDFSNVPNTGTVDPTSPIGLLTRPVNGQGGNIRGLEFSGAFDFGQLWKPLTGLGFTASQSLTWTSVHPSGPNTTDKLPGFSKSVRDITVYYENSGFQARISQRYRSSFRGEVVQLFTALGYVNVHADQQWDGQIGYTFQKGSPLEGLGILLQVNNLLNSPYRTQTVRTDRAVETKLPEIYEEYGRQFLFGVNYKF